MRAALVTRAGQASDAGVVTFSAEAAAPPSPGPGQLLLRVLASSFAAGDVHMLSGRVSLVFKPERYPYCPGMDVCGAIVAVGPPLPGAKKAGAPFEEGDEVAAFVQRGACMADFVLVDATKAAAKPASVPAAAAAACVTSSVTALNAAMRGAARVRPGDRVLVLGGSGGVGSSVVQLAKAAGAGFVAATSTQGALLQRLGCDRVLNHREPGQDWWRDAAFRAAPLDVIIDCVGGNAHYAKACSSGALKGTRAGGRFVAVSGDVKEPLVQTVTQLLDFAGGMMWAMLWRPLWASLTGAPAYSAVASFASAADIREVLALMEAGKLSVALDERGPFPFSADGVRDALSLQQSGRAHGKVVVDVAREQR
jgi:NADPH:quinone reductase-like Zn-dependent oxidoreductase